MSAQMLSFTRTEITPLHLERAMVKAVVAVLDDARSAGDGEKSLAMVRVQSMAAAYADLSAQLGLATPETIERWLEMLDAFDLLTMA